MNIFHKRAHRHSSVLQLVICRQGATLSTPQAPGPFRPTLTSACCGGRVHWLILALLLTRLLPHLDGQTSVPPRQNRGLGIIGGPGGDPFSDDCPDGSFLTGLALRTGDDVDAVRQLCLGVDDRRDFQTVWHGGTGGTLKVLLCPPATPAVIGLDVAAEGQATIVVNNIHVYCGLATSGKALVSYPDAVFDGPAVKRSSGSFIGTVHDHQGCPRRQIAIGVHGSSGSMLDAVGLICATPPAHRTPPANAVSAIGRVPSPSSLPADPHRSICDAAAAARARNSPAAPDLEEQCNAWKAQTKAQTTARDALIAVNEKKDLAPGPSGAPVSVCDAAQAALNRNAPEAADLVAKCRASGGGQSLITEADQLAASGATIASEDTMLAEFRRRQPEGAIRRGFDVGVAATGSDQLWGPGKQRILDALKPAEQEGFEVASSFVMDRNRNAQSAATGAAMADSDPLVAKARTSDPDVRYWLGFDIASALFGDPALGSEGSKSTGPGSERIQAGLSAPAQRGFIASTKFHLGRSY